MKYCVLVFSLIFSNAMLAPAVAAQADRAKSPVDVFLKKNTKKPADDKKQAPVETEKKISSTASNAAASETDSTSACRLTIAQSPALRGLKLGMTIDEVQELFTKKIFRPEKHGLPPPRLGFRRVSLSDVVNLLTPNQYPTSFDLSGIESGSMEFLDDVMTSVELYYIGGQDFDRRENEFRGKVTAALNLPDAWVSGKINCGEFTVSASASVFRSPKIELKNNLTDQIIKQREKEETDRRRDAFKP